MATTSGVNKLIQEGEDILNKARQQKKELRNRKRKTMTMSQDEEDY